jgi:3'(2'), 5'-bisphosphate nucleotidase
VDPARISLLSDLAVSTCCRPVVARDLGQRGARVITDDDELARDLAEAAGQRLLALRQARRDGDADSLRRDGDRQSHEFLAGQLARIRPADALLSEEGRDDHARLRASRVWIVDPLDGTREFGEPGRSDWAVHVALWELGELTAGAVALPAQGRVLSTAEFRRSAGPARSSTRNQPAGKLRLLVSRTRPPAIAAALGSQLGADLVPLGSAGAKAAAVICGDADAYLHSGGQYEWDSAAPVAVALAAGLHASRIDGAKLVYNQADPSVPDILMCQPALAGPLLEAISIVARRLDQRQAGPG